MQFTLGNVYFVENPLSLKKMSAATLDALEQIREAQSNVLDH